MRGVLGIDSGATGGLCHLGDQGSVLWLVKTPRSAPEAVQLIGDIVAKNGIEYAVLEDIYGLRGQRANGLVNFGKQHGWLEAALCAHRVRYQVVKPSEWQKAWPHLKRKSKGEPDKAKKARHKAEAMRLFPEESVTLWNCDALLIAEWARRQGR